MLAIDRDKIGFIISKAQMFEADMPDGDDDPGSDLAHDELNEVEELEEEAIKEDDNVYEAELHDFIEDLNEDEQIDLVALAWVGRGSFSIAEWSDARNEANQAHNQRTAEYLLGLPLLADYLREGLSAFDAREAVAEEVDG